MFSNNKCFTFILIVCVIEWDTIIHLHIFILSEEITPDISFLKTIGNLWDKRIFEILQLD